MLIELQEYYIDVVLNDTVFLLYAVSLIVDVITGNAVALYQRKWNSKTGINGTLRHLALLSVMSLLLPFITYATGVPIIANGVMLYVITQYTLSILENLSAMGVDIHEGFGKYFEYLNPDSKKEKQERKDNK